MAQIFHRSFNTIAKATIFGALFLLAGVAWVAGEIQRSPWVTEVGVAREQPVPFSHKHHVGELGLDCRFCHGSVEESAFAGMPSSKTCMSCHSQLFTAAPMLEPVRASYRDDRSIEWTRVHDLPDFVYFDHSVHVSRGVGCESCHGRVDRMPLMWREETLLMSWCLECHRHPELYLRPRAQVFTMGWDPRLARPARTQEELGPELLARYGVGSLTSCSACHR